jgi:predicted AAA+ superfamily ATPase
MLNLLKFNKHWNTGFRYEFPKTRKFIKILEQHLDDRQIVELTGLRRTGKTTLFFQLINILLKRNINPQNIWYFSFDEEKYDLDELFTAFKTQTRKNINKDKIFIFFDEIQKLEGFQSQLKIYYDLYPNLKFFISGSTSLYIKKKTQESLAGRVFPFELKPLDFEEYLHFRNNSRYLEMPEMFQSDLEVEFENYLSRQFVETVNYPDSFLVQEYVIGIIKKIVFEDIPIIFPVDNPEILYAIIKVIAGHPGLYLHYENLGNDLKISAKTVSKYISILEQAFIVKILYNYSANQLTSEKKMKRIYLSSSSFCTALQDLYKPGMLVENTLLSLKPYQFFWRDAYNHEVDFIEITNKRVIPTEVKYKTRIRKSDYNNLYLFCKKFESSKAIMLVHTTETQTVDFKGLPIEIKPVYKNMTDD